MRRNRVAQDPAKALDGIEGTRPASKAGSEKDATNRIKVMVSALSLTRPVKHRDSEIHRAGSLRETQHALGNQVTHFSEFPEFNLKEAAKTYLYEFLPPCWLAPAMCLLLEPNRAAAYNVMRYRQLLFSFDPEYLPHGSRTPTAIAMVFANLVIISVFLRQVIVANSDVCRFEQLLSFGWFLARWAVIAVKYGYMPEIILEAMTKPPPIYSFEHLKSSLFLGNWITPVPDYLRHALDIAQEEADVDLRAISVTIEPACECLSMQRTVLAQSDFLLTLANDLLLPNMSAERTKACLNSGLRRLGMT
jgi:hypothetical protein